MLLINRLALCFIILLVLPVEGFQRAELPLRAAIHVLANVDQIPLNQAKENIAFAQQQDYVLNPAEQYLLLFAKAEVAKRENDAVTVIELCKKHYCLLVRSLSANFIAKNLPPFII